MDRATREFCIDSNLRKARTISATAFGAPIVRRRNKRLVMPSHHIGLTKNVPGRYFAGRCKKLVVHSGDLKFLKSFLFAVPRARKTALIKKFRSSENDGGLNCANGRGQVVSKYSRLRRSEAFSGTGNPNARANPRRIRELSKTLSSPKVAKILGISKKTVQRHLRGEFGKGKYAG